MPMTEEQKIKMAERHALDHFLSDYPHEKEYDDIIDQISEGNMDDILIWEPFENHDPGIVAGWIENLKDATIVLIENVLEKPEIPDDAGTPINPQ